MTADNIHLINCNTKKHKIIKKIIIEEHFLSKEFVANVIGHKTLILWNGKLLIKVTKIRKYTVRNSSLFEKQYNVNIETVTLHKKCLNYKKGEIIKNRCKRNRTQILS